MKPTLSSHFQANQPSAIRTAQQLFLKRTDKVDAVNAAIGNVSLPMHSAMQKRMFNLKAKNSPFGDGIVKYTQTKGTDDANAAMLNILQASDLDTRGLHTQITEGGSAAMELVILGVADYGEKILMIDPAYTNYLSMAKRTGRKIVTLPRKLKKDGEFDLPDTKEIEKLIKRHKPKAVIVIPYDNPTGQKLNKDGFTRLAKLVVKYGLWLVSDEAYRGLHYKNNELSSVWMFSDEEVKGIRGHRISIETASKIWNACGLRIGGIISDNEEFIEKSIAENTANLCPNAIGQYIFAALAEESVEALQEWFESQRNYYKSMMFDLNQNLKKLLQGVIISDPEASLYSVVDFRDLVDEKFNSVEFAKWAASEGIVDINGKKYTLLFSPMTGFYSTELLADNPGRTQVRLSYVETPEKVRLVPELLVKLFEKFN